MTGALSLFRGAGEDPRLDLAFEEDQLALAARGEASLSLHAWARPTLVLGYAQEAASVDLAACARLGVPVYRRLTGGTGVLHHLALSASLALPAAHPAAASIGALYDGFVEATRAACAALGCPLDRGAGHGAPGRTRSPICFEDTLAESLLRGGRKVLGCAQARRREACLVHGTLLLGLDAGLQAEVYGVPRTRVEAALGALPEVDREALARAWSEALAALLGRPLAPAAPPDPSPASLSRYGTSRWSPGGVHCRGTNGE